MTYMKKTPHFCNLKNALRTDGPTDRRTDRRTDGQTLLSRCMYDTKSPNVSFGGSPCFPANIRLNLTSHVFVSYGGCSKYMSLHRHNSYFPSPTFLHSSKLHQWKRHLQKWFSLLKLIQIRK